MLQAVLRAFARCLCGRQADLSHVAIPKPLCPCQICCERSTQLASLDHGRRTRIFWRRILPLILGWGFFIFLCYRISQAPPLEGDVIYNPFEILGISDSTTEKQIKKHYKKAVTAIVRLSILLSSLTPSLVPLAPWLKAAELMLGPQPPRQNQACGEPNSGRGR